MSFWKRAPRALVSMFLAVAFAIATVPGAMAMPAPQPAMQAMGDSCCDHMKPPKDPGAPCKNMPICLGMMSCFGMAVLAAEHPSLHFDGVRASPHFVPQAASGLTLRPDIPPPIA